MAIIATVYMHACASFGSSVFVSNVALAACFKLVKISDCSLIFKRSLHLSHSSWFLMERTELLFASGNGRQARSKLWVLRAKGKLDGLSRAKFSKCFDL